MNQFFTVKPFEHGGEGLFPLYEKIMKDPEAMHLKERIEESKKEVDKVLTEGSGGGFESILRIAEITEALMLQGQALGNLNNVKSSDKVRKAFEEFLPLATDFFTKLSQDKRYYKLFRGLRDSEGYKTFSIEKKKVIDDGLLDFELAGVHLEPDKQKEFQDINKRLTSLSLEFANHVLDDTNEYELFVEDESVLGEMPEATKSLAHEEAVKRKKTKPNEPGWLFTLQESSYLPLMKYAVSSSLREKVYRAHSTRATKGDRDNAKIIDEVLALRQRKARLLGYTTYSDLSVVKKMAPNVEAIKRFLWNLVEKSKPVAEEELKALQEFRNRLEQTTSPLNAWDVAYYSEKLRQETFDYSEEEVKAYFPIERVVEGTFKIIERLFDHKFKKVSAKELGIELWDENVSAYALFDANNELSGHLFLDLYSRQNKRSGAWMQGYTSRRLLSDGKTQLPSAYVVANFAKPSQSAPSLLVHREVETVLHEMGHAIHHLFVRMEYPLLTNGVPWDGIELPSQWLEYWSWDKEPISDLSEHHATKNKLPSELLDKLLRSKQFQAGMFSVRQLEFALTDMELHTTHLTEEGKNVQSIVDGVRRKVSVLLPPAYNKFQNAFLHLFSGGAYASGYYSYKWAEVLAADAFSLFEERGIFDKQAAERFMKEILEKGSSDDFMKMYVAFRGREPNEEALLRHTGISKTSTSEVASR